MLFFIGSEKMPSVEKIKALLSDELKGAKIEIVDETTSTNSVVKEKGQKEHEWYTLIARKQSAGKGRLGRSFFSPCGTGVYFSILLKPKLKAEQSVMITAAAAVAATRALEKIGASAPVIKWVNDIYVDNKKTCGILTEGVINTETKCLEFAVLGVGVNLTEPEGGFPEDIKSIAGAAIKNTFSDVKSVFVAEFLNEFFSIYKNMESISFMDEYRERCFVLGEEIDVITATNQRRGKAISIDDSARLEVVFEDGSKEFISSGEISIKINKKI